MMWAAVCQGLRAAPAGKLHQVADAAGRIGHDNGIEGGVVEAFAHELTRRHYDPRGQAENSSRKSSGEPAPLVPPPCT